jgi:hypothetical protein
MPFIKVCQKDIQQQKLRQDEYEQKCCKKHHKWRKRLENDVICSLTGCFWQKLYASVPKLDVSSAKTSTLNPFYHRNFTKNTLFLTKRSLHANVSNGLRATFSPSRYTQTGH